MGNIINIILIICVHQSHSKQILHFTIKLMQVADTEHGPRKGSMSKKTAMVKTPLDHFWTFWFVYKNPNKNKTNNYDTVLKKIFTIDCIEDFWKYTSHQRL